MDKELKNEELTEEKVQEIMKNLIENFSFEKYQQLNESLKKLFADPKVREEARRYLAGLAR